MKIVSAAGIKITLGDVDTESLTTCYKGGTIESPYHETCHCGDKYCDHEDSPKSYNIAIDAIESLVLALAVAGIDVETPAFHEAVVTALDAVTQKFDI